MNTYKIPYLPSSRHRKVRTLTVQTEHGWQGAHTKASMELYRKFDRPVIMPVQRIAS